VPAVKTAAFESSNNTLPGGIMLKTVYGALLGTLLIAVQPAASALTKDEYKAEKNRIEAEHKTTKEKCKDLQGNEKDVCQAEAKAAEKKAKAKLEANYKNTPSAQKNLLEETAEADYSVAKARCDGLKGNEKDVCVKDAKAAEKKAKADAKTATAQTPEARADARAEGQDDKRDAEYKAAKERCDSLSGDAKDKCQGDVKARFGK
jgi:hypothetical protein